MKEKLQGKADWLFYIIPGICTVVLVIVVLNFIGFPVWKTVQGWGKPLFAGTSDASNTGSANTDDWKKKYLNSLADMKEKDKKIADLTKQTLYAQTQLLDYKDNNENLKSQLNAKVSGKYQNELNQIANIYGNMPETKAANILGAMPLEDAALTVSMLDTDEQSSILSSMRDAQKAAEITLMLKELSTLDQSNYTVFKQQIHDLALKEEDPAEMLAEAIGKMPAKQSAGMLQSLMGTNSALAVDVFKHLSPALGSQIVAELGKTNGKLADQLESALNN